MADDNAQPSMAAPEKKSSFYLVVHNAFEDFRRGDVIKDAKKIEEILKAHLVNFVHKVDAKLF